MNLNLVVGRLINKFGYNEFDFKDKDLNTRLRERGLEVWKDNKRCMVTKEYNSQIELENWFVDQVIISLVYDSIPMRYRNNLYFLLVTNINHVNEKSSSSIITEIEKNNKVCRKYVLESLEDLQRVPSLSDNLSKDTNSLFDFDSEFRKYLFDLAETEKTENSLSVELKEMIEVYFDYYDSQDENKEELKKEKINEILQERVK
ncbi:MULTISPECIES: ABC-three component system middle component 1 [Bacillus]|uniref:ABC-three component system middle component 1 n=1 Tax=Bacillus TaxID=1386 RepID=UPI000A301C91|nr:MULTISPECIES: ABC-three component system middle component 1 [Bacillus]MCU5384992.1 hypothetical protein [Bacillus cereus]MEB5652125.1 hypothetical protein [Bacillus anthracis]MEC3855331.1 ABC-three component system middle component 1 [Bacillus sp. WOD8 KX774193]PEB86311.1 hypothetical protein COM94_15795 [Bacillus thuringiensis]PGK97821.1 hypothetical protein CN911_13315 [Bacillus thuringiensis]